MNSSIQELYHLAVEERAGLFFVFISIGSYILDVIL